MWIWVALALGLACPCQDAPPAAPTVSAEETVKAWVGRHAEFEEFIRATPMDRIVDVPVGVTRPRRAFFKPGGLMASVIVKTLKPGRSLGYWESYQSEIAAYEMDRLLGLDMVPPTVEKRIQGDLGSAQLWVEDCVWLKTLRGEQTPDVAAWNRQVYRQRVFDNLIGNIDRNEGNLLVRRNPAWHLILVDHSRAFTETTKMQFPMTRIDRPLFESLKALDEATVKARIGKLVLDGGRSLIKRRNAIVAHFEKLAAEKGEAEVFIP